MSVRRLAGAVLLVMGVAACAEAPAPPAFAPPPPRPTFDKAPRGHYKLGAPYRVNGVLYTPRVDYGYDHTGTASWYGPGFHGNLTANGERFDQNSLSAAHATLPLPSLVRVTNLDNGRALVVRVNDRGPFVGGRILDVSAKAARLLGFWRSGTARVRVQVLEDESRDLARRYGVTDLGPSS